MVKPLEFDVKKILIILCVSILCSCGTKETSSDQLVERQGIYYEINSEVPYTGRVTDTHQSGQISSIGSYKDGKKDGPWESYYGYQFDRQLKENATYKDGKKDGPYEFYYENGQLMKKGSYKDGRADGPYEIYYMNGQLFSKVSYKDGEQQEGTRESYHMNGELKKFDENGKLLNP